MTDGAPGAVLAAALLAVDPRGLGGLCVRSGPGPARDALVDLLRRLLGRPFVRVPLHVSEDRLLGGLSLVETLRAGRVVGERGLLAEADGGAVVAAMAERLEARVTAALCAALDRGELQLEREGITAAQRCRVAVIALDEGEEDERPPAALLDRLAFHVVLPPGVNLERGPTRREILAARRLLPQVEIPAEVVDALCDAARALGAESLRGPVLAAAAARAHAALRGAEVVEQEDAEAGARLVLGPRATRVPAPPEEQEPQAPEPETHDDEPPEPEALQGPPPEDILLEAARSGIPKGLLGLLEAGVAPRRSPRTAGRSGARRASSLGGRPAGSRPGTPSGGDRLDVVSTLRAAAPWQPLRRRERFSQGVAPRRVEIRGDDLRITRFVSRTETCVIFAVDASGSAALQRLAEAKGAVEQVLGDCHARRDHVALIAFRGKQARTLLAPTRSLTRVKRELAGLAGGGTTPLAAGIDAALLLAGSERRAGRTPVLVMMTDGRANVARDGTEGSAGAGADALAVADAVRAAEVRTLFLDTAPRPRAEGRTLAARMGARYLPLPYLDAAGISRQVHALSEPGR